MAFRYHGPCIDCDAPNDWQENTKRCPACHKVAKTGFLAKYRKTEKGKANMRRQGHRLRARAARAKSDPIAVDFEGQTCAWCETAPAEVVDHVLPLAHGGDDTHMNKVPACRACNAAKGDLSPLEYLSA